MKFFTIQSKPKLNSFFASTFIALFLSSCAVGPDYQAPKFDLSDSFTREHESNGTQTSKSIIDTKWWSAYDNSSLDNLVDLALTHNPSIQVALSNLKVAQQNTIAQQGFFYPSITAGYAATRQNGGATLSPSINNVAASSAYSLHTAGLTVGFVPDIFGVNKRMVESLKSQELSQKYQYDALQISLVTNLISSIAQVSVLNEQVNINKKLVEINKKQLEHSSRLFNSGYASEMDVANQQSIYSVSKAQLSSVQKAYEQALDLLHILCGENPNSSLILPSLESISLPNGIPVAIPSDWINQRPDIKAAEEMVHSSNAQIGVAIGNMLPQISLTSISGSSASALSELKNSANNFWSNNLNLNQTLFAGGTFLARKKAAEFGLQASIDQYKIVVLNALQNVADSMYAINEDMKNLDSLKNSENANLKILNLTKKQFQSGYVSEPILLAAESNYLQSKINRIQAHGLYLADTASLYQSLGGGWRN